MRLKISTSSTTMSGEIAKNTNSTPRERPLDPRVNKDLNPVQEGKWSHPKHWKQHAESADALQGTVDEIRASIDELEKLREKVTSG